MSKHTLADLAKLIGAELHGDANVAITGINTLTQAQAGQITFLDNARYRKYLADTKASAVILAKEELETCKTNALVVANPYLAYAKIAGLFERPHHSKPGIHPTVIIGENCNIHPSAGIRPYVVIGDGVTIAENVYIGSHCTIGDNVQIGADSRLWSNVTVCRETLIGERTIIHSGAVIGSDGFGNANDKGNWVKVPQLGRVRIGNDVEIGANTTIDRGAIEDTIIEDNVRLDNQIQVAHNVHIGAHTAIAACTGIAGSTKIGKYCMIGGGAGITGHIELADKVMIGAMSGVSNSIQEPGIYTSGFPVQPHRDWWKNIARFQQLDQMARKLQKLEKLVQQHLSTSEDEE